MALPPTLSFGFASGAVASVGGGVLSGFFVASLKVTPILFSGPTGPMTQNMTAAMTNLPITNSKIGTVMTFTIMIARGVFQFFWGALQLGQCVTVTSYEVIADFTFGIGIILVILRHAPFLGRSSPRDGIIRMLWGVPELFTDIQPTETLLAELKSAIATIIPASKKHISDLGASTTV